MIDSITNDDITLDVTSSH